MRVRVDEARNQHMLGEIDDIRAAIARADLRSRQDGFDLIVAHGDGVVLEHDPRRFDRDYPARANQESFAHLDSVNCKSKAPPGRGFASLRRANGYFGMPCTSTSTRRFGSRHAISALRSFWSGQLFTGI